MASLGQPKTCGCPAAHPPGQHAHSTLTAIVVILGLLLLGIAHVAWGYGVMVMDQTQESYQNVFSQLAGAFYEGG